MIKNWTVKTKQIKGGLDGFINHHHYLLDDKRASHHYSQISNLNGSNKAQNIANEFIQRKEERAKNGLRGGGVRNLATSFVVSLPRDVADENVTQDQWRKMAQIMLFSLADDLNLKREDIFKNSVVVLHDESKSPKKSSHLHILVSNVQNGVVEKKITQHKATYAMKKGINKAVKQVLKIDNLRYEPEEENVGNKPLYIARQEKEEKEHKKRIEEIETKEKSLKDYLKQAKTSLLAWFGSVKKKEKNDQLVVQQAQKTADSIDKIENDDLEDILDGISEDIEKNYKVPDNQKVTKKRKNRKRRTRQNKI